MTGDIDTNAKTLTSRRRRMVGDCQKMIASMTERRGHRAVVFD